MKLRIISSFALALLLGLASAQANTGPDDKTAKLLNFWKTSGGQVDEGTAPLPPELADIFDYDQLTSAAIEPHKERFNNEQLQRYSKTFGDLLRRTVHTRAGQAIGKTDYKVSKSKKVGKNREVEVSAYLPDEDITTNVVFVWEQSKAAGWQVIDVRIDGASLVNDYRNQFGRMLGKDGVDGFIAKLQSRLDNTGNG